MTTRERQPLLHAALNLGELGIPVVPTSRTSKSPVIPKAQGGNGLHDATTDPSQIIDWWGNKYPGANIAIRTGVAVDVVDIDSATGLQKFKSLPGYKSLNAPVVKSARGWHLYVKSTGLGSHTRFLPDCDFRGLDSLCTVPPSVHPETKAFYTWVTKPLSGSIEFDLDDVPEAPDWLVKAIRKPERERHFTPASTADKALQKNSHFAIKALIEECQMVAGTTQGGRNHQLCKSAYNLGQLVGDVALDESDVRNYLTQAALEAGMPEREILPTINSGLKSGMSNPRSNRFVS